MKNHVILSLNYITKGTLLGIFKSDQKSLTAPSAVAQLT